MSTTVPTTVSPAELPACAVDLSVAPVEFPATGGTATVRMVANRADCSWSLQAPAWVSLASTSGTGSAQVTATIGAGTEARSDAIRLLHQAVTISQAAPAAPPACAYGIEWNHTAFPGAGGTQAGTVVTNRDDCRWTLVTAGWFAVTPADGRGRTTFSVSVPPAQEDRTGEFYLLENPSDRRVFSQTAAPESDRLGFSLAKCFQARAGTFTPLACVVEVREGRNPLSTGVIVTVDRSPFGGSSESRLLRFMGSYDMDLNVPAGFPKGTVGITFTVTDDQGRRSVVTVPLEIT